MKSEKRVRRLSIDVDFPSSGVHQIKRRRSPAFLQEIEEDSSSSNKQKAKNGDAANSLSHLASGKATDGSTSLKIFPKIRRSSLPFSIGIKTPAAFSTKLVATSGENSDASTDPALVVKESDAAFMGVFQKARRRSSVLLSGIKAFAISSHKSKTNSDVSSSHATEADDGSVHPGIVERIRRRSSAFLFGKRAKETISFKSEIKYDDDTDILPYRLGYLTETMIEEAKNVLNETEETRQIAINKLRELVKGEKNLFCRQDDAFLLQYLRARKFNIENAFKLIQNSFEFRREYSDVFDNLDLPHIRKLYLENFFGVLPTRDRFGCLVVFYRPGKWDPAIYNNDDIFRAITVGLLLAIDDPATQVTGFRIIIDCRGVGWKQVKQFTPRNFRIFMKGTQSAFPGRYKAIHLLSDNRFFNIGFATANPLFPRKLKGRIMHHEKDVKALHAYIHPSSLPTEYGGTAGPCDFSFCANIISEREEELLDSLSCGYQ